MIAAQKALEVAEMKLGLNHPEVAVSLHNPAELYSAQNHRRNRANTPVKHGERT